MRACRLPVDFQGTDGRRVAFRPGFDHHRARSGHGGARDLVPGREREMDGEERMAAAPQCRRNTPSFLFSPRGASESQHHWWEIRNEQNRDGSLTDIARLCCCASNVRLLADRVGMWCAGSFGDVVMKVASYLGLYPLAGRAAFSFRLVRYDICDLG